jgi:NADH-quinone oxidoreductase subunit E
LSIRRLAKEQPASFAFSKDTLAKAKWWLTKYPEARKASGVIPILWLVQKQEGWISEPALRAVAELCGLPFVRVYEVATFYTMFQLEPVGKVLVQVCGTTPCMLRGAQDLMKVCRDKIGGPHHMSEDGWFTWEEVECLGACSNAPMAAINDYYYEDLTPETLAKILDDFAAGKDPKPGSYDGRGASEPKGAIKTLTDPKLYDGSAAKKIKIPNLPEKPKASKAKSEPAA